MGGRSEGVGGQRGSGFERRIVFVFLTCWSKAEKDREGRPGNPGLGRPDAGNVRIGARRGFVDALLTRRGPFGTVTRRGWGVGTCAYSPGDSNMKVTTSPVSSAFMVMMSSLPAHLSILDC